MLAANDPLAIALHAAIRRGDIVDLQRQLAERPALAGTRIVDDRGVSRTLLHVVADWPGHVPNAAALVATLVAAGADVNAPVIHTGSSGSPETALHWAASSNDVALLDALLDHGANIEAPGAVFTGGTSMSDAVVFAQWAAARQLLARGATTTLWQAAALGLAARVRDLCAPPHEPTAEQLANALWHACRADQVEVATLLLDRGADANWIGHDRKTPLDVALEAGGSAVTDLLRTRGATRAPR